MNRKQIRKKAIQYQNNMGRNGGHIPSMSEAIAYVKAQAETNNS